MKSIYSIAFAAALGLMTASCGDDNTSDLRLSGDCDIKALQLETFDGIISKADRSVTVRVPETFDVSAMKVNQIQLSEGAESNIHQGQTLDMNAGKTIHVTNGDVFMNWTLSVMIDEAKIKYFALNDIYTGIIDQASGNITVYVPKSAGISSLIPTISYSENATCQPMSGMPTDFSQPVKFTIDNNSAHSEYTVNVKVIDKPSALFVGAASNMSDLDPEAKAACSWMMANVPNSLYASFADLKAETIDLSECKIIWWHYHKDGGVDGHDAFVANAPEALDAKNQIRSFYENGGSLLLTRYAGNLASFIGATGDDEWTTPNNCWGQNEDAAELCGGPWDFNIYEGQNSHPLFANLVAGDDPNKVYCTDKGYHITNSTSQYHIGTDWGGYDDHAAWEARNGGKILGVGGDGAVVAWEYPAHDGKGGIIGIGSGCYDWYSYTFEDGYVENFHTNIAKMTQNAIDYLTK